MAGECFYWFCVLHHIGFTLWSQLFVKKSPYTKNKGRFFYATMGKS
ncbi:hypothetical protein XBKB1_2160012 [Xenorhabdus bovienii str. kraussei Becker Underwood]|uniref:Uncharacterized protein n=1 Tax=Xenorhabdus bovienii str. kraussei Becker Underwood TaxID=1398204 RepID=A0A077PS52_XENBV|nr:hypothetical protein XBKB1_2160012 [Xenorhabdus bovienii str. kraussei Becker Underwood]